MKFLSLILSATVAIKLETHQEIQDQALAQLSDALEDTTDLQIDEQWGIDWAAAARRAQQLA